MRTWAWVGAGLLLAACAPALDWREVRGGDGQVWGALPCRADQTTRAMPLGGQPTDVAVQGCQADGATFVLMRARLAAGQSAQEVLAGWQAATWATWHITPAQRQPFAPPRALAIAASLRVAADLPARHATASGPAQKPGPAEAVWAASATPDGVWVVHAVVLGQPRTPQAADRFFEQLRLP